MRYLFSFLSIVVKKRWFKEILISYLMVGHTHEKVNLDLFATVGNLKKIKNCPTPEVSFFCGQKFHQMPTKTGILFGSFILELKRIPGGKFEIHSKSGWFSGILNQMRLFGSAGTFL
jgi:hypothetical protein